MDGEILRQCECYRNVVGRIYLMARNECLAKEGETCLYGNYSLQCEEHHRSKLNAGEIYLRYTRRNKKQ